jgi:hypothetical protein
MFKYFSDVCSFFAYQTKGTHLNAIGRFYIHKEASPDSQLYEKHTIFPQMIFDTIIKIGL